MAEGGERREQERGSRGQLLWREVYVTAVIKKR
jgi:hypothetical protein